MHFASKWSLWGLPGTFGSLLIEEVIRRLFAGDNTIGKDYDIYPCSGFMREYKTLFLRPDWVLVYKLTKDTLCLSRTGSPNIAP